MVKRVKCKTEEIVSIQRKRGPVLKKYTLKMYNCAKYSFRNFLQLKFPCHIFQVGVRTQ